MAIGAVAIAFSSATEREYSSWKEAAQRESKLYQVEPAYVAARMEGRRTTAREFGRTRLDWLLVGAASLAFAGFALMAKIPRIELHWTWLAALSSAMLIILFAGGMALWRTTGFE
jgi:hypothetical protein